MRSISIFLITAIVSISLLNACGPSEEELREQEQARQDSLEQVRQDSLEQIRQQQMEQARQDSIEAEREREAERNRIEFSENGPLAIQVEAWRSADKAQNEVQKWIDRGFEQAHVVQHGDESTGNVWFRVRLGRVDSREMADKIANNLMEDYEAESWITGAGTGSSE